MYRFLKIGTGTRAELQYRALLWYGVENKNRLRGAESGRACVLSGVYQEADTVWVTSFTL